MKKLLVILLAFISLGAYPETYYVAPKGGRDSNSGTDIDHPWATWHKALTTAVAGDTVYFRGGVYMVPYNNPGYGGYISNKSGTASDPICFFAYPEDFDAGIYPVLDLAELTTSASGNRFFGIRLWYCSYMKFKGLTIRNLWGNGTSTAVAYGFYIENCNNITFEQCTSYNSRNIGFDCNYSDKIYYINCDAWDHCDSLRALELLPGNGGYGFSDFDWKNSTGQVYYRGCRAWNCSDDGFVSSSCGLTSYDSCWSFNNGMMLGAGNGFKMGWVEPLGVNAALNRKYTHCLAVYNRANGFVTNEDVSSDFTGSMEVYNNTAYHNGYFATRFPGASACGFNIFKGWDTNEEHQLARTFKNNLAFDNEDADARALSDVLYTHSNNSWDSGIEVTSADFLDLDSATADGILKGSRQKGGSLPDLGEFLKLKKSSKLINAGTKVGLPYHGSAPDIGSFESNYEGTIFVTDITVTGTGNATSIVTDNGTLQLIKTILPTDATNQTVTWSIVSGTEYGTINSAGLVTALNNGTVIIKASANDGSGVSGTLTLTISNQIIPVTGISVSGAGGSSSITNVGGTLQLYATVLPSNSTNKNVTWSVVNETGQATISNNGLLTAVNNGSVSAIATATDGSGISGSLSVSISNQIILVSGISVSGTGGSSSITIDGGTLQLNATVLPDNATNKTVTWSLVNETGKATISSTGLVTAVDNGIVTARATANDGSGMSEIISIIISNQVIPVSDLTVTGVNDASIITSIGGTLQLNASVLPVNATEKSVTWTIINNTGEADISLTGQVTALANGTVIARATANDGSGVYGTLTITISEQLIPVSSIIVTSENDKNTMNLGNLTLQLNAAVSPGNATDKTYTWSVLSGTGQASINSTGLLTALTNGNVTAIATANDGSGVAGSYDITIQSFAISPTETNIIYIDPTNQNDPSQDGTMDHPFASWNMVVWKEGYSYLQKRSTIAYESKINITSGDVTLGSYGDGDQPIIQSSVNDFAIRTFEKSNILIKDLHITAVDAISCIYILGETCDNICIEYCTLESSVNGARILDGKNVVLRYNTFINCSEAIYCYADKSSIYYNVFRDNEVAISSMASMANAEIYNNVFYNNAIGISNTYTDLTLYNNIFYLVNVTDKAIYNNQLNQLISDNNIFYPEQTGFIQMGSKIYSSLDEYQHDLGIDMNSITDDPEFVDAFNQDFSISPSSPAINAGKILGLEQDFFGTRVPSGGLPDIGLAELKTYTTSISHLNDPGRDDFQVYPNPNRGIFNLYVKNNNSEGSRITIRDLSGKMVYENIYNSDFDFQQEIDISNMQKGVYIVSVEDNNRSLSQPIIIK